MAKNADARREVGKRPKGGKNGAPNRGHRKGQGALKAGSAIKHSNAASKPGRTAPNGETRVREKGVHFRSESTIKRLQMYNKKPDRKRMKEQALKPVRIQPDRRWFGNTRVIAQDKMQAFRETIAKGVTDPFSVVIKASKLPMSLLRETEGKASRMNLLSIQPYSEVFSKGRQQKRVKLGNYDLEGLVESVDKKTEGYDGNRDGQLKVDLQTGVEKEVAGPGAAGGAHKSEEIFNKGTSRRIWAELYKVVDSSDVIVFVLDARDPMGTRCMQLEREIRKNKAHKHIVLVLNKVDLVPTWVSRRWIQILMKDFPTLAFHASITNPFGKNALLNLLRQFSNLMKDKKHVTVGMIGYPNVGKSSVINTLKRKKVCKAAPIPGETRVWQYIALTKRLYLLDCPGIVPPSASDFSSDCAKVLKGVVRAERIQTPSDYIDEVISRVKRQYLLQRYKLPPETAWTTGEEFLAIIGQKMGKLFKGGEPDLDTAARIVLYDWQRGRIPYFTAPPEEPSDAAPAPAADSAAAPAAGEEGPAALQDGEAPASAPSSSSSSAPPPGAAQQEAVDEVTGVSVRQSLSELACSLEFDEEDRRGEAPPPAAGAEAGEADAAAPGGRRPAAGKRKRHPESRSGAAAGGGGGGGGEAEGAAGARGAGRGKRGAEGRKGGAEAAAAADGQAPAKKRKVRRGSGRGRAAADGAPPSSGREGMHLRPGAVDWQAVVAEFGM